MAGGAGGQGTLHMARDNALEGWGVTDAPPAAAGGPAAAGAGGGGGEGGGGAGAGAHGKEKDSGLDKRDVLVSGRAALNRGMDMDRVVVEVLPKAQWRAPRRLIVEDADDADEEEEEEERERAAGAAGPAGAGGGGKAEEAGEEDLRPTCRVVCP